MENEPFEAELYLDGYVKWDGCAHIIFPDEGYMHLCGKRAFDDHVAVMNEIFERCSKKIVNFNREVAGYEH